LFRIATRVKTAYKVALFYLASLELDLVIVQLISKAPDTFFKRIGLTFCPDRTSTDRADTRASFHTVSSDNLERGLKRPQQVCQPFDLTRRPGKRFARDNAFTCPGHPPKRGGNVTLEGLEASLKAG